MPLSEARKRANKKYNSESMTSIGIRVSKKKAEEFRAACAALGVTPYSVIKHAVDDIIMQSVEQSEE